MRHIAGLWLVLVALAGPGLPGAAQGQDRGAPDEAVKDVDLLEFRSALIKALERKDQRLLTPLVHPRVAVGGAAPGLASLMKVLETGNRWREVANTLRLGGAFTSETVFRAPYARPADAKGVRDPAALYYLRRKNVDFRDRPANQARVIKRLDFGLLEALPEGADPRKQFLRVRTMDNATGFVHASTVRPLKGSAILFAKTGDKWQLLSFEAE